MGGCDYLTIAPKLLAELEASTARVAKKLSVEVAKKSDLEKIELNEAKFRWLHNEDRMATEKLAEGIRNFSIDIIKLENTIKDLLELKK